MKYALKQVFKVKVLLEGHSFEVRWQSAVATDLCDADRGGRDDIEEIKRGGCRLDLLGCQVDLTLSLLDEESIFGMLVEHLQTVPLHEAERFYLFR